MVNKDSSPQPNEVLGPKLLKGGVVVALATVIASPLGYLIRLLFSRTLTPEMYGLLYASLSFIGVFATYNDLGFGYALSYLLPKSVKAKDYRTGWNLYVYERNIEVITALVLSGIIILASNWLAMYYFKTSIAAPIVSLFCLYFVANSYLSGLQKFFVGLRQEVFHTSIQPLTLIATFGYSVFFYLIGQGTIYTYTLSWALSYFTVGLIYTWIHHRTNTQFRHQPVTWQWPLFKRMLHYAVPSLLTSSIFTFILSVDTFYLTMFKGVTEVGIYNVIIPLVTLPAIFFTPLDNFLFPYISHFADDEKHKIARLMSSTQKLIILVAIYFGLFIALFPAPIIGILFGNQWLGATEFPLAVYASFFAVFALSAHFNTIISGLGRVHDRLKASALIATCNVIIGAYCISQWGVIGAVITNIIINLFSLSLYILIIRQEIQMEIPRLFLAKVALLVVIILGLAYINPIAPNSWVTLVGTGLLYTSIFGVLVGGLKLYELDTILETQLKTKVNQMWSNFHH